MNHLTEWKTRLCEQARLALIGQAVTRGIWGLRAKEHKMHAKLGEWVRRVDTREVRAHRRSRVWRELAVIRRRKSRAHPPRGNATHFYFGRHKPSPPLGLPTS